MAVGRGGLRVCVGDRATAGLVDVHEERAIIERGWRESAQHRHGREIQPSCLTWRFGFFHAPLQQLDSASPFKKKLDETLGTREQHRQSLLAVLEPESSAALAGDPSAKRKEGQREQATMRASVGLGTPLAGASAVLNAGGHWAKESTARSSRMAGRDDGAPGTKRGLTKTQL